VQMIKRIPNRFSVQKNRAICLSWGWHRALPSIIFAGPIDEGLLHIYKSYASQPMPSYPCSRGFVPAVSIDARCSPVSSFFFLLFFFFVFLIVFHFPLSSAQEIFSFYIPTLHAALRRPSSSISSWNVGSWGTLDLGRHRDHDD
jgi:hypothetical protein